MLVSVWCNALPPDGSEVVKCDATNCVMVRSCIDIHYIYWCIMVLGGICSSLVNMVALNFY